MKIQDKPWPARPLCPTCRRIEHPPAPLGPIAAPADLAALAGPLAA